MNDLTLTRRTGVTQFVMYWGEKFGDAWFWILGLGIIHHHAPAVPALGYWLTFLLWFLLGSSGLTRTPVLNELNTKRKVV